MAADASGQSPNRCLRVCTDVLANSDRQKPMERDVEKVVHDALALSDLNETEKSIVSNCAAYFEHHQDAIKAAVDCFYKSTSGRLASRADYFTFSALAVLPLIHGQHPPITFQFYSQMVMSTRLYRTTKFMEQLFQVDGEGEWLESAFCQHFDQNYVKEVLLTPLQAWSTQGCQLLQRMRDAQNNKGNPAPKAQPVTEPKPFTLTETRRRAPSPEQVVVKPILSNPVPKSTYVEPAELEELAAKRQRNFAKAEETLLWAEQTKPSCAVTEKSQHARAVIDTIKAENEAKLQFNKPKACPLPKQKPTQKPKRNAATIMREGARLRNQEMEEAKRVAELAAGGGDDQAYQQWKLMEETKDFQLQLQDVERKHLEGLLSFEQAMIAQQHLKLERHQQVTDLKAESEELLHQLSIQRMEQEEEMRRIVEETIRGHEHAKEAREKVQQHKQELVREMERENEELLRKAREQAQAEHEKRVNLIMDIRAMERVPIERFKEFDRMTTGNHGLLLEMSVAELQERVAELKIKVQEDERNRRAEIEADKIAKERMLIETEEAIRAHHFHMLARKAEQRKMQQLVTNAFASTKDPLVTSLKDQLEQRRAEKERLQNEFRSVSTQPSCNRTSQAATKPLSRLASKPMSASGQRSSSVSSIGFQQHSLAKSGGTRSSSAKQWSVASLAGTSSAGPSKTGKKPEPLFPETKSRLPAATRGRRAPASPNSSKRPVLLG